LDVCFGCKYIFITNNFNHNQLRHSESPNSISDSTGKGEEILTGNHHFYIQEIEVFGVSSEIIVLFYLSILTNKYLKMFHARSFHYFYFPNFRRDIQKQIF
jgi:hypothetical protein